MPRVSHFEIDAEKPEKLVDFYTKVFNWTFEKWEGSFEYWLIRTGDEKEQGINGGLMRREPDQMLHDVIDVPSLDEYVKKVQDNGGMITVPKKAVPGVGWIAYFEDEEGNKFGMMEEDDSAK